MSNLPDRYLGLAYPVLQIYCYMDKLQPERKELVEQISYNRTKMILGGIVNIV